MNNIIKFRVWMSNDINPDGRMYYPEDVVEIGVGNRKDESALLLNQSGGLILSDNKREGANMNWARISNNGIDMMQYIGLNDKFDKEIYEGDIVKRIYYPIGGRPDVYEYSYIGVVKYNYNSFGVVNKLKIGTQLKSKECLSHEKNYKKVYKHPTAGEDWFDKMVTFSDLEVIGNIYENSELIEV